MKGFKCGIEIHQQLDTAKLFCDCPSIVHDKDPDIKVIRRLRAVAGETGEIDAAAAHEKAKARTFIYEACSTSSCLVELDEEPPHQVNQDALIVALQAARLFHAQVVDEIQVMRKTVVDGSNVSGFQRTALVATDGYIETSKGDVPIPLICLEEEAAKKIKEEKGTVIYKLDRLGVPLLEVSTDASIKDPEHAKECAQKIGMILRSTGKVKRGIGTIRQDVNVSISGGARTEIKGFQDLKSIPTVIEHEIKRQQEFIAKGKKVDKTVRKAEPDGTTTFLRPMPGSARMYPETDVLPIIPIEGGEAVVELIEDREERFLKEYSLSPDLASKIARSQKHIIFEKAAGKCKSLKPAFIAETLISAPREIRRKHDFDIESPDTKLDEASYLELFTLIDKGAVPKEAVLGALVDLSKGTFDKEQFKGVDTKELETEIKKIIKENPGKPMGALMGMAMARFRGKADGKSISELIKRLL